MQNSIHTIDDVRKEKALREELEILMHRDEVMGAQKARNNWIILGDRNTKYFQTVLKQGRARNQILHLKAEDGSIVEDQRGIENLLVDHFKKSYKGSVNASFEWILNELQTLPIPQLSNQENLALNCPITNREIELTVFQLGSHKAPVPDGIPAFFY